MGNVRYIHTLEVLHLFLNGLHSIVFSVLLQVKSSLCLSNTLILILESKETTLEYSENLKSLCVFNGS